MSFASKKEQSDADVDGQHTGHRYYNASMGSTIVRINQGHCYVTGSEDEILATVLGSCVSACIRDPLIHIGGMNHFMLPFSETASWAGSANLAAPHLRYGNFAMEQLINGILSRGGERSRLEIKLFGGGNVLRIGSQVGHSNADFVEQYLRSEGLKVAAKDLRGDYPRKIRFFPTSGKVQVMQMPNHADEIAKNEEKKMLATKVVETSGDIEIWD